MKNISKAILNPYKMMILLFIMLGSLLFGQSLPHNLSEDEKKRL